MSETAYAAFGALGAQIIATLFVAALLTPKFLRAESGRGAKVRIVYALLMALGLFSGVLAAVAPTAPRPIGYVTIWGLAAGVGAVVGPAVDQWLGQLSPKKSLRPLWQIVLAVGLVVAPAATLSVFFGNA